MSSNSNDDCGIDEIDVTASFCNFGDIDVNDIHGLQPLQHVSADCVSLGDFLNDKSSELTDLSSTNQNDEGCHSDVPQLSPLKTAIESGKQPGGPQTTAKPKVVQRKRLKCAVENCSYSTPHAKDLARHMRKHTGEKPFQCHVCNKCFSRFDKLKIHNMTHTECKPYKCEYCAYASVDSGSLKKHIRTHTNERPYRCQLCSYKAKDHAQLVVHLRHHTGDTPYVCKHEGCTSAFKTPSDLQRHTRLHSGEKPYACHLCAYRAAVKCNLNSHLRKVHKIGKSVPNSQRLMVGSLPEKTFSDVPFDSASVPSEIGSSQNLPNQSCIQSGGKIQAGQAASEIASLSTETAQPKRPRPKTAKLPFQYACKSCDVKCDTLKSFQNHIQKVHKDMSALAATKQRGHNSKSVIVSPLYRKKGLLKPDVAKLFECELCSAAFAREDSLRVHLRQHNDDDFPTIHSIPYGNPRIPSLSNEGDKTVKMVDSGQDDPSYRLRDQTVSLGHQELPIIVRNGPVQGVYVIVRNTAVQGHKD